MYDFGQVQLDQVIIHKVGNKQQEEDLFISKSKMVLGDNDISGVLLSYFLTPFKSSAYYNFSDTRTNEMYAAAVSVFADPKGLYIPSVNMAKRLYEESTDSKFKGGELYVAYLKNCLVDGEPVDAIGLFKSESKETYLKIVQNGDAMEIIREEGFQINKLDKGCVVFNIEKENGYRVCVVESKSNEPHWKESFLKLKPREDSFHQTQNYLQMCKGFVKEVLNEKPEVAKADQIDLLNKSVKYFKENETFNERKFEKDVMQQPEIIEAFQDYKSHYQSTKDVPISDEFDISTNAVKDSKKIFKSVLKLDKNFSVYIHGNKDYIAKGHDEPSGLSYYTLFYREEK